MNIDSARLRFRLYRPDDFPFLLGLLTNPEVVRYIGSGQVRDEAGAHEFYDRIVQTYKSDANLGLMVLEQKADGVPVGHAGLVPQTVDTTEELEIGYWIDEPYWGRGFATEAALALRDFAFDSIGVQRIISLIQPGNAASRAVAAKVGMRLEKEIVRRGQSVYVYALQI